MFVCNFPGIFAANICSELKKCCMPRSRRRYNNGSFIRRVGGRDSLRRTPSNTMATAVYSASSPSNEKSPKMDCVGVRYSGTFSIPVVKGKLLGYYESPDKEQLTHNNSYSRHLKYTANGHIDYLFRNINQNNNGNVFKEAMEKLNTTRDNDNIHDVPVDYESSLCDTESDCEEGKSVPMIVLSKTEPVPPPELDTSSLLPSDVITSHHVLPPDIISTNHVLPSGVMTTRQSDLTSGDNPQTLLYPLLVECDSDESIDL